MGGKHKMKIERAQVANEKVVDEYIFIPMLYKSPLKNCNISCCQNPSPIHPRVLPQKSYNQKQ